MSDEAAGQLAALLHRCFVKVEMNWNGVARRLRAVALRPNPAREGLLRAYDSVSDARQRLGRCIEFYNTRRPHSSLGTGTPDEYYFATLPAIQQAA